MNDFGPFSPSGGYVWSSNAATEDQSWLELGLRAGASGVAIGGAAWWSTRTRPDGSRPIDTVAYGLQQVANESPFQFLHTFRAPEWISPFTSVKYQGLAREGDSYAYRWGHEVLHNEGTYQYLRKMAGFSDQQMEALGLTRHADTFANLNPSMRAEEMIFRRTAKSGRGSLFVRMGNEEKLFAEGVRMMQLTPDAYDVANLIDKRGTVNRAFFSVLQSMDLWTRDYFGTGGSDRVKELFSHFDQTQKRLLGSAWAPVIADGPVRSFEEAWRRSSLLRAPAAFGMERFNRLVGGFAEQVGGETFSKGLHNVTGFGLGTVPAPASKMFWRFGTKAAAGLGLYYGLQESDWVRRQGGLLGHVGMAGATSAGLAWFAGKAGFNSKRSGLVGLASFAAQMTLPGFEKGVWPGIVNTYANANVLRANSLNPFNYYRRVVEGYLPGASDFTTGAALGAAAAAAAYVELPWSGKTVARHVLDRWGDKFGMPAGEAPPETLRNLFWSNLNDYMQNQGSPFPGGKTVFTAREKWALRKAAWNRWGFGGGSKVARDLWIRAEDALNDGMKLRPQHSPPHPYMTSLIDELTRVNARWGNADTLPARFGKQVDGLITQAKYAFFGTPIHERTVAKGIQDLGFRTPLGRAGLLFFGAIGMQQLATGGLLGSKETASELEDIYSGRKLVEVKKGRFWEGGGTPYEGGNTSYHRPHYVALTLNRVRERGAWGEDEDSRSPLYKAYLKNFTYEWEKEHYWDRPYPISHAAFQDVPIIGGFLAQTIGRVFKPARLMHPDEWLKNEEGTQYSATVYQGWRREPSYALGAETPGMPLTSLQGRNQLVAWVDQFRELEGLTGWAKSTVSKALIGTDLPYSNSPILQNSGQATSDLRRFWENSMGGGFFMNEAVRRIFPSAGAQGRKQVNPIVNMMPSWMPDSYHYGDPYTQQYMEWGEARLPGAGYEALHPELRGVPMEDYPLIYRYDILSQSAPFSKELRQARRMLYTRRRKGETDEDVNVWMDEIDRRVQDRYNGHDFRHVHPEAIELPGSEFTQSFLSRLKLFMREGIAPVEYMVPMGFRPMQKLLGNDRSPIEQYEYERMYGTPFAFWDKPWRDWFRPAAYSALHNLGFSEKPGWRKEADATNSYFDKLEFMQFMKAAEMSKQAGNYGDAFNYEFMASSTLAGTDPYGDPVSSFWAIPREDRSFFNAFAHAPAEDRGRILEMVPESQARIYQALWDRIDNGDPTLYAGQGRPKRAYLQEKYAMVSEELAGQVPEEDWVGWNPDVDMDDIRVRYIENLGKDISDYGMWQSDLEKSHRQQFLNGAADPSLFGFSRVGVRGQFAANTGYSGSFTVHGGSWRNSYSRVDYDDRREAELRAAANRNANGY